MAFKNYDTLDRLKLWLPYINTKIHNHIKKINICGFGHKRGFQIQTQNYKTCQIETQIEVSNVGD